MLDWIWQNILENIGNFLFIATPSWVWLIVAALAAAWVWKTFGKEGLITLALTLLGFFSYRQGWKDSTKGDKPKVPVAPITVPKSTPKATPKKHKSLKDVLKERTGG